MTRQALNGLRIARLDLLQHDIDNRVACIEVAAEMLCEPDLSPEDREVLEQLRDQALSELRVLGRVPTPAFALLH